MNLDRFDLYELCVQSPRHVASFLRGVHPGRPTVLGEDFCGTAAVSRRWIADADRLDEPGRAIAVDLDPEVLAKASSLNDAAATGDRVRLARADCAASAPVSRDDAADVIFVGNFSIGYIHTRAQLLTYLRRTRARLALGNSGFGGGAFVCDTYGGATAFGLGGFERRHPSRGREVIRYAWQHETADPATSMVENSISFRVELDGEVIAELPRAFVYRWRLWSIAELREAMVEAGFARTAVYKDVNTPPGERPEPVEPGASLGEDWIVLVAAFLE
jgi:hypothetical protein